MGLALLLLVPLVLCVRQIHGFRELRNCIEETVEFDMPVFDENKVPVVLRRNGVLFSPSYKDMVVLDGQLQEIESLVAETDCHWIGKVKGMDGSSVAVSFCGGDVAVGSVIYGNGTCDQIEHDVENNQTKADRRFLGENNETTIDEVFKGDVKFQKINDKDLKGRGSSVTLGDTLYIEILLVSDPERIDQFSGDLTKTAESNARILNEVAAMYQDIQGISVYLSIAGSIYWPTSSDDLNVGLNPQTILLAGNEWRRDNLDSLPVHDVTHYMTGKDLQGTTVGIAQMESICDDTSACSSVPEGYCATSRSNDILGCCIHNAFALSQISYWFPSSSAATIAHELGHQLGFSHDSEDNAGNCAKSGYIMAAVASSNPLADLTWSSCSQATFQKVYTTPSLAFGHHPYQCLTNEPGAPLRLNGGSSISISVSMSALMLMMMMFL